MGSVGDGGMAVVLDGRLKRVGKSRGSTSRYDWGRSPRRGAKDGLRCSGRSGRGTCNGRRGGTDDGGHSRRWRDVLNRHGCRLWHGYGLHDRRGRGLSDGSGSQAVIIGRARPAVALLWR